MPRFDAQMLERLRKTTQVNMICVLFRNGVPLQLVRIDGVHIWQSQQASEAGEHERGWIGMKAPRSADRMSPIGSRSGLRSIVKCSTVTRATKPRS